MKFVLILMFGFGFNNNHIGGGNGITTQEFNSLENCIKAGNEAKNIANKTAEDFLKFICVEK